MVISDGNLTDARAVFNAHTAFQSAPKISSDLFLPVFSKYVRKNLK
jgi:hypothetical protein